MTPEQNVHDDFLEFLKALNDHQVEYLVIGGHAVGFHGRPRDTGDMDIVIKPTAEMEDVEKPGADQYMPSEICARTGEATFKIRPTAPSAMQNVAPPV